MRRFLGNVALPFLTYLLTAAWVTWPLASRAFTQLPNPSILPVDILPAAWLLAWQTHALTTDPMLLPHPNAFHPAPFGLFYSPPALGALPAFAPIYLATGSAAFAYNATFLLGMAAGASALAAVVRRWTASRGAALVAGFVFLASPAIRKSPGTAPLCAMLLGLVWVIDGGSRRNLTARAAAALIAGLVMQGLIDPVIGLLTAVVPLCLVCFARLPRPTRRGDGRRLLASMVTAGVLLSPLFVGYGMAWLSMDPAGRGPWSTGGGDVTPAALEAALRSIGLDVWSVLRWRPPDLTLPRVAFVAVGAVLAARRGALSEPGWRHAALWTAVGVLFLLPWFAMLLVPSTAGDLLALAGRGSPLRTLLGPGQFGRLTVGAIVAVPLLVGLAAAEVLRALGALVDRAARVRVAIVGLAVAAVLAEHAPLPRYRTFPEPFVPAPLRTPIVSVGGTLLELPADRPMDNSRALYRSIGGWWPLVNGYASFWPAGFAERLDDAKALPDRDALGRLVEATDLRLVLVDLRRLSPTVRARWTQPGAVQRSGLRRIASEAGEVLFLVER